MAKQIKSTDIAESDIFGPIKKSAEETLTSLDKLNEELKQTAKIVDTELKQAFTGSAKGLNDFINATKKANKLKQDSEKIDQQTLRTKKLLQDIEIKAERAKQAKLQTESKELRLKEQKVRASEKEAKAMERAAKAARDENDAYKKLVKQTRDLKNESKRLGAELIKLEAAGKKNTKEYRQLEREYGRVTKAAKKGDAALKKLDKTVGDNFRNVGNYTQVLGKARGALAQLGLAFGGFQLLKGAGETIANFEQSIANLSAITGATGEDLKFLENAAIELGGKTTLSASQVAEGFKLIGSAKPELLENSAALTQVTEDTITLAEAAGLELPEAAAALTSTLNQFGAGAEEAGKFVDVLAAGSKFGAGDINFLNGAMQKAGTVANVAGLSFRETAAALEVIAKSGAPAEKAGTDFRNVLINLQKEGIGFVDGQFEIRAALEQARDSLASIEDPAKRAERSTKLFGKQSVATAQFLMENIDLYDDLNAKMDENGIAAEQQKTNTETLQGAVARLKSAYEEFILRLNQGTGFSEKLRVAIDFLARNFDTIVTVLGEAIKLWGIYRVITSKAAKQVKTMTMNLWDSVKALKQQGISLKTISTSGKGAVQAVKAFGSALKSIGFAVAIDLAIKFANAMYEIATGIDEAREAEELRARVVNNIRKRQERQNSEALKAIEKRVKAEERAARERIANGEKEADVEAELLETKKELYGEEFTRLQDLRKEQSARATELGEQKDRIEELNKVIEDNGIKSRKGVEASKELHKTYKDLGVTIPKAQNQTNAFASAQQNYNAQLAGAVEAYKQTAEAGDALFDTLEELDTQVVENTATQKGQTRVVQGASNVAKEINTEFKNQIDLTERLNELKARQLQLDRELEAIGRSAALEIIEDQIDAELAAIDKASEAGEKLTLERLEELQAKKLQLQLEGIEAEKEQAISEKEAEFDALFASEEARLEEERLKLIKGAEGNADKIKEINANFNDEMANLDKQRVKAKEVLNEEIQVIEAEALAETSEMRKDHEKETNDQIKEIRAKAINDLYERELKETELALLESGATREEIDKALAAKEIELLEQKIAKKKELGLDTLDDEIALANKRRALQEKDAADEIAREKARAEERIAIAKAITSALIEQSNRRIKKIDEEIAAAEKQADFLREKAIEGNITAEESLAEQQRIIEEANARKEAEQRRQQRIQFAQTAYETYQRNAADENVANPLGKTITDLTLLEQFVRLYTPTFLEGTEDTGTHGMGVDGKGGFHAILHPNERVLTKEQNARVGSMSNEDLSRLAMEYQTGAIIRKGQGAEQIGKAWESTAVIKRLESLEQTIKAKPETNIEFGEIIGGAMQIIKSQKSGNSVIYNRYKVK